ncbi:hypothetical protein P2H44_05820 [Albimonas sp. CAU 1670]|nr:hypothetical protein [Albimonas sp. CAU 1670]MDF2232065.1 hypothetical protein [Albimonas sp. CAU 1670]
MTMLRTAAAFAALALGIAAFAAGPAAATEGCTSSADKTPPPTVGS